MLLWFIVFILNSRIYLSQNTECVKIFQLANTYRAQSAHATGKHTTGPLILLSTDRPMTQPCLRICSLSRQYWMFTRKQKKTTNAMLRFVLFKVSFALSGWGWVTLGTTFGLSIWRLSYSLLITVCLHLTTCSQQYKQAASKLPERQYVPHPPMAYRD